MQPSVEKRVGTTRQAAKHFGFHNDYGIPDTRSFLAMRQQSGFPKPILGDKHHLWWDFKAIEQFLDKQSLVQPKSTDHSSKIRERLAQYGNVQSELSR